MDTLLWILQAILCIKLLSVAFSHGFRRDQTTMQQARLKLGAPAGPLLTLAALSSLLVAGGLVLPAAAASLSGLAPIAAVAAAAILLVSLGLHVAAREQPKVPVSLVLFAMAAFLAYGRWVLAPLGA